MPMRPRRCRVIRSSGSGCYSKVIMRTRFSKRQDLSLCAGATLHSHLQYASRSSTGGASASPATSKTLATQLTPKCWEKDPQGRMLGLVQTNSSTQPTEVSTAGTQFTLTPWDGESSVEVSESELQTEMNDDERARLASDKCVACGGAGLLLLCDGHGGRCNATYHVRCVGLAAVPSGEWFCPQCSMVTTTSQTAASPQKPGPLRDCAHDAWLTWAANAPLIPASQQKTKDEHNAWTSLDSRQPFEQRWRRGILV